MLAGPGVQVWALLRSVVTEELSFHTAEDIFAAAAMRTLTPRPVPGVAEPPTEDGITAVVLGSAGLGTHQRRCSSRMSAISAFRPSSCAFSDSESEGCDGSPTRSVCTAARLRSLERAGFAEGWDWVLSQDGEKGAADQFTGHMLYSLDRIVMKRYRSLTIVCHPLEHPPVEVAAAAPPHGGSDIA